MYDDDEFWDSAPGRERAARREARRAARRERRRAAIVTGALVFVAFAVGYLFGLTTPRGAGSRAADESSIASPSASPPEREPANAASRSSAATEIMGEPSKSPKPPGLARAPGGARTHPWDPGRGSTPDSFTGSEPGERRDLASEEQGAPPAGDAVSTAPAPTGAGPSRQEPGTERAPSVSSARTRVDGGSPAKTDRPAETSEGRVATSAAPVAPSADRATRTEKARPVELPPRPTPTKLAPATGGGTETVLPRELPRRPTPAKLARATVGETETGDSAGSTPARVAVRIAVAEWIAANRMRDLERLVGLYAPAVSVFGNDRDVARAAVRRDKARTLAQTEELSAGEPTVVVAPGGRTASTRVRLRYVTAGRRPGSGEVIRELGWVRMPDGWKIASERDVAELR